MYFIKLRCFLLHYITSYFSNNNNYSFNKIFASAVTLNTSDNIKDMRKNNNGNRLNITNPELDLKTSVNKLKQDFPFSFVLNRGISCTNTINLTKDVRRMLEPYTATKLRELHNNGTIEDFVKASQAYDLSRLFIFDKCENELALKIAKLPNGPTLSFKVEDFTPAFAIDDSYNSDAYRGVFCTTALVILNNCISSENNNNKDKEKDNHMRMVVSTFQNMFPTFGEATVSIKPHFFF